MDRTKSPHCPVNQPKHQGGPSKSEDTKRIKATLSQKLWLQTDFKQLLLELFELGSLCWPIFLCEESERVLHINAPQLQPRLIGPHDPKMSSRNNWSKQMQCQLSNYYAYLSIYMIWILSVEALAQYLTKRSHSPCLQAMPRGTSS